MSALIITIHVIVCVILIMVVLLQTGKGADIGAAFGAGGSQTLFGASGGATVLSKATTVAAIIFMLTSLTLAYMGSQKSALSIVEETPAPVTKSETATTEQGPAKPATGEQASDTAGKTDGSASTSPAGATTTESETPKNQ